MKLSKAQIRAIEDAKKQIQDARSMDYPEWMRETAHIRSDKVEECIQREYLKEYYDAHRKGDVLCTAGKNTIDALVRMGIFKVVKWDEHRQYGVIDWVHYNEDWEA